MKGTASVRIAVVGAGLSRLVAASRLVQAGGGLSRLPGRERMRGGSSALAERLAAHCEVQTATVVSGIGQDDASVRIELADGATVSATRAILAIPLPLQRRLRFGPPLPEHRRLALMR